jgi:hypothetical protein
MFRSAPLSKLLPRDAGSTRSEKSRPRTFRTGSATATDSSATSPSCSSSPAEGDESFCADRGGWSILRQGGDGGGLPKGSGGRLGESPGPLPRAVRRLMAANRATVKAIKEMAA